MSNAKLLDMASHVINISGNNNKTLLCSQTKNEQNKYTYLCDLPVYLCDLFPVPNAHTYVYYQKQKIHIDGRE